MDVQVLGAVGVLKHGWPALCESGGRVVLVSSANALGRASGTPYSTGKSAVIGLTRSVAMQGEPAGVRANAIMPLAWTRGTQAIGARYGDEGFSSLVREHFGPERVAAFVAFLAHKSSRVNGELFTVGAGRAARVFIGVGRGWGDPAAGPEDFRDHLDEILDISEHAVPRTGSEELIWALDNLGLSYTRGPFLEL
jgi:NAD(P)-dependent dehydrogenase (short-subunit alcohol dehydrogenase family)